MMKRTALAALVCFALVPSCVAQTNAFSQPVENGTSTASSDVVIGANDSVTIVAINSDEISKTWRVSSTGELDLPMVGRIHAAGLTAEQLEKALSADLKRYIRDPEVTVYVSDFRSQPVTIAGAVHHPGTFQLEGSKTLLESLSLASGPDAPGPTLIVSRPIESGPIPLPGAHLDSTGDRSTVELKLSDVLDPSTAASNLEIRPNDIISVSTQRRLVYIIGEVSRPGAVELVSQDSISVMQVLAAAGGLTKVASPGHSQIMRLDSQGLYKKVASIDLKRVMTGRDEDRLLKSGDIIVVPSSSLKAYGQAASSGAITTGLVILTRY